MSAASPAPFTYAYYEKMIKGAVDRGFVASSFEKYDPSHEKTLIVRHDVDYTLVGVMKLAEIEAKLGVSASYLFRVHAHEYNLFAHHTYVMLKELRAMGHEIGLHLEAMTFARATGEDPADILKREKAMVEFVIGEEIQTVSEHRDVSHVIHETAYYHIDNDPHDAGFKHFAMDDKYFKEMKYLSDSNGVWREGDLLKHIDQHDRFQILVHPEWWFEKDLLVKAPYFHGQGNGDL